MGSLMLAQLLGARPNPPCYELLPRSLLAARVAAAHGRPAWTLKSPLGDERQQPTLLCPLELALTPPTKQIKDAGAA